MEIRRVEQINRLGLAVLTAEELNWLLDGFDLWQRRPHKVGRLIRYNSRHDFLPVALPDDSAALKQSLAQVLS